MATTTGIEAIDSWDEPMRSAVAASALTAVNASRPTAPTTREARYECWKSFVVRSMLTPISIRQLGCKSGIAKTETAFWILPQPLLFMQKTDRAGDCVELIARKTLRDIGKVEWRFFEHSGDFFGKFADDLRRGLLGFVVGLAAEIIGYLRGVGVSVGDAFEAFLWNAFRDRGVDADLGGCRHDAVGRRRQRWIERFAASVADDQNVAVALHAGCDRPFDFDRIEHIDVVIDHDDMFDIHDRERSEQRVLAIAGLLLDRDHRMPEGDAAHRHVDVLDDDACGAQGLTDRGITRRRHQPGIFPGHMQRVIDRVAPHRHGLDADDRIPVKPAHQPGELAETPLGLGTAGR